MHFLIKKVKSPRRFEENIKENMENAVLLGAPEFPVVAIPGN